MTNTINKSVNELYKIKKLRKFAEDHNLLISEFFPVSCLTPEEFKSICPGTRIYKSLYKYCNSFNDQDGKPYMFAMHIPVVSYDPVLMNWMHKAARVKMSVIHSWLSASYYAVLLYRSDGTCDGLGEFDQVVILETLGKNHEE